MFIDKTDDFIRKIDITSNNQNSEKSVDIFYLFTIIRHLKYLRD